MNRESIHFVTGRLAEPALRRMVGELAEGVGFHYTIQVMPITVAALMTPRWIAKRIRVPDTANRVVIPGYCRGELELVEDAVGKTVERGPRDLWELPEFFGKPTRQSGYGQYDIQIIAEINHAPRMTTAEVLEQAHQLRKDGANIIDVGCEPGERWFDVDKCVRALCDEGHRVSIDSMDPGEIAAAVRSGAELVLSVNHTNRHAASDWGCEVIVIPDEPETMAGLDETIEWLSIRNVPLRIDPVLEPIGFGFARSLQRYMSVRQRYLDTEMMMGVGNLTELTDVDSAGVNVLLLAMCQELGIRSILTTQVINWARSAVQECDYARRLVYHAVNESMLPKHLEPMLVLLRDVKLFHRPDGELESLARQIKDKNYRIFADRGEIHMMGAEIYMRDTDPFHLFERFMRTSRTGIDANHAFYLGYEMCKAMTALTLGKQYRQDESLDWGFLTVPEKGRRGSHQIDRSHDS